MYTVSIFMAEAETISSTEILVTTYQIGQCHEPEYYNELLLLVYSHIKDDFRS
jgi:hypothetical protein